MEDTLYADVLFAVNFAMDFVSLYICSRLLHLRASLPRFIISAAVGGLYGIFAVLVPMARILSFAASLACSLVMILITVGVSPGFFNILKYTAVLWGVGALLAGGVTFVCSLGPNSSGYLSFSKGQSSFFILSVASFGAVFLIKCFAAAPKADSCLVKVSAGELTIEFSALTDSGNLVREPMSGLAVIFVKKELMARLIGYADCRRLMSGELESLSQDVSRRIRAVAVSTVGGERVMYGILPDAVDIKTGKKYKKSMAVIAAEDKKDYGGREALLPQSLIV